MDKTVCPVCNGLTALYSYCPTCKTMLTDQGRYLDSFDDYSPYRPIDDLKMTDGLLDFHNHTCPHSVTCSRCGFRDIRLVSEI
jgi:hypothetical protein